MSAGREPRDTLFATVALLACGLASASLANWVQEGSVEVSEVVVDRARLIARYRALATRVHALRDLEGRARAEEEVRLRRALADLDDRWRESGLDARVVPQWVRDGAPRLVLAVTNGEDDR